MVEAADFADEDRIPELHAELNRVIKEDVSSMALEVLRLNELLMQRR